ncbi:MAG: universal stress protein [Deltaproteobacteria bacterium]|nr:universal stress protein [Deltaproteobacteria bacterium]
MENNLEKVLVCVEDVNLDENVIEYTHMIAKAVGMKSVHLLHVIHDIPAEERLIRNSEMKGMRTLDLDAHYESEIKRLTLGYQDAMKESGVRHFGDLEGLEQHVDVRVGNQLKYTLEIAHDNDVDLIVMGRHLGARLEKSDAALLARRITRKATCSVLTIPENFTPKVSSILCPVRYSPCSTLALQTAIDLGVAFNARILALNLFQIYHDVQYPAIAPDPELPLVKKVASGRAHAEKENELLREDINIKGADLHFEYGWDEDYHPAEKYEERVQRQGFDLVVIGARGRTGAAGVLLGSITEQLIKQCKVPVLATRKKGEHIGVLKAILALFGKV